MPREKDTVWMEWHSIERGSYKEDRVACNHCQFECVAQSSKLKRILKKCQLYLHTQSSQNRASSSTSYQPPVVPHRVTATEKDVLNTSH